MFGFGRPENMEREAPADLKPADVMPHAESAAPVDMRPIEITTHEAAPCRCSPCNGGRAAAAPTPLIVLGLIGLNYIPLVLFLLDQQLDGGRVVSIVFFHLFLILLLLAYFMAMCTDPGVPPVEWQRKMQQAAARGESVQVCRRSGLYKPPRSHYDSVTERLTLNMDHFCPWVVNTVGFYNRKFFILFLVYTNLTLLVAVVTLFSQAWSAWDWLQDASGAQRRWFSPGIVNTVIYVAAIVIDVVLLCMLIPFMQFHLRMAARNETTIEGYTNSKYDVGARGNLQSVFGRELWTWPLPLYFHGPDGDGLHWPTTDSLRESRTVVPRATSTLPVRSSAA